MVANPQIHNVNVADQRVLISPSTLRDIIEIPEAIYEFVSASRKTIEQIIDRQDHRLMVVVGPCSIHDVDAALDYANRLKDLSARVAENLYLVMRVYFEKPRTTVGWKGLINDPNLDDSFEIENGLTIGRTLLREILALGLPTATEALDPITPQYLHDLISWSAIGARTTESQTHREMASGLSMPIGFKNSTDGDIDVALNAIHSAQNAHTFFGVNQQAQIARVQSTGNPYSHLIIRGGVNGPNYSSVQMEDHIEKINNSPVSTRILVDCSHGNSQKKAINQPKVLNSIKNQILNGNTKIMGAMIESFLVHGCQNINMSPHKYGQSVTDECLGWDETVELIEGLYNQLP